MKIIYDIGAHDGSDIKYYILKSDIVVAVEANPKLCNLIKQKFHAEIANGNVIVVNAILNDNEHSEKLPFYIHKFDDVCSQLDKPEPDKLSDFDVVNLPSVSIVNLIRKYGNPFYLKLDIEGFDIKILKHLFDNKIYPEYISAESHNADIFAILVNLGLYKHFKLTDGHNISKEYNSADILTKDGSRQKYRFPYHSAGPFGEDILGEWYTANDFVRKLALEDFGWKDIHATRNANVKIKDKFRLRQLCVEILKKQIRHRFKIFQ